MLSLPQSHISSEPSIHNEHNPVNEPANFQVSHRHTSQHQAVSDSNLESMGPSLRSVDSALRHLAGFF